MARLLVQVLATQTEPLWPGVAELGVSIDRAGYLVSAEADAKGEEYVMWANQFTDWWA